MFLVLSIISSFASGIVWDLAGASISRNKDYVSIDIIMGDHVFVWVNIFVNGQYLINW